MREFLGRTAFITGGASGIGLAVAEALANRGMRLVLTDSNAAELHAASAKLRASGVDVIALTLDVADRAAFASAVKEVETFGKLHVVCANAGIPPSGTPIVETEPARWDRMLAINLTGVFNTVHALTPLLRAHGDGGHIVITSSMAGMIAASPIGDYTVAKYGVTALGETLAVELAPANIGVTILMPGSVATALNRGGRSSAGLSPGMGMNSTDVGVRTVRAIESNELFVFTHAEYRPLVAARCEALLSAFGESAQPGFSEPDRVLDMMRNNAYPPAH